ncbi:MAG: hypothetical protein IPN33_06955 [Saprospiraceae bacterium]|nr:hypothetical protein [Saprospiraceae bacterium]
MSKISTIFHSYLSDNSLLDLEKLGSEDKKVEVSRNTSDTLKNNILRESKFNNNIVVVAIVLLCIIFGLGIFFAIYYRDSPTTIGVIFGGTFLSLLAIVSRLRKIWLEKSLMDVSLSVIEDMSPQDAAKFIQTIYYNMLESNKKR